MAVWKSRLKTPLLPEVSHFLSSVETDAALAKYDIMGSIAHATMLGKCGIIPQSTALEIVEGLKVVWSDLESGKAQLDPDLEDVHMNVEALIKKTIGDSADHLHAGRSRNDQVALDLRLYLREATVDIISSLLELQATLVGKAEAHKDTVVPGHTHLQQAQPVPLGMVFMAHFHRLQRDIERLQDAFKRINVSPLGAAALAGTSLPIDPALTAALLGFEGHFANSMDAVSDRDFAVEFVSDLSIIMVHLSQLSEEMVLWSSREFGWMTPGPGTCTGSSIMPQKRNPDVFELVRGKAGKVVGDSVSLMMMLKGLPLAYNRDLQEDKPAVFDAVSTTLASLVAITRAVEGAEFHPAAPTDPEILATDEAEALVKQGVPFRQAYKSVGARVAEAPKASSSKTEHGIESSLEGRGLPGHLLNSIDEAKALMKFNHGKKASMVETCSKPIVQ